MKNFLLFSAVALMALASSCLQAQVVSWGPATDVSLEVGNSSDVSVRGTVVEAFNTLSPDQVPNAVPVTVNTVVFTPTTGLFTPNNNNGGVADLSNDTNDGDPEYDTILSMANFGGGTDATSITLGGGALVTGNEYEIQIWYVDDRTAGNPVFDTRETPISDASGNTVTLNDQYSIGSFTATGPTLELTLESPGFGQAHISAYQIRDVTNVGTFVLGDVNLDGTVDFLDIAPFISLLSSGEFLDEADVNRDNEVTFLDISPFITLLSSQ